MSDTTEFPTVHFPVVFADGVTSISNTNSLVKFYLYRIDPSFAADGKANSQSMLQIVMPMESFAGACVFFEKTLQSYIAQGFVGEKRVDELRAAIIPRHKKPQ